MKIPALTYETIETQAERGSVERGRAYFESGAVKALRRTAGDEIEAYVQGSDIAPYHVQIKHDADGIISAECTCPYVGGSWCRHIVATLIAVLAGSGTSARSLNELLDEFDRVELIHLIERLAEVYPGIADTVEGEVRRRS